MPDLTDATTEAATTAYREAVMVTVHDWQVFAQQWLTNRQGESSMFQRKLAHWPGINDDLTGDDLTEYTQGG